MRNNSNNSNNTTQQQNRLKSPNSQQQPVGAVRHNAKAINYIFLVTYALISAFLLGAAFWGISIATFNQIGLLLFTVAVASGMILSAVEGNRQQFERGVFRITQGFRVFVVLTSVLSLLTAWAPAYNLINVLVSQCPLYTNGTRPACNASLTTFEAFQICQTEWGYAIALIILCFVIMLLDLASAVVYGVVLK